LGFVKVGFIEQKLWYIIPMIFQFHKKIKYTLFFFSASGTLCGVGEGDGDLDLDLALDVRPAFPVVPVPTALYPILSS
jgi:hypothetical protein